MKSASAGFICAFWLSASVCLNVAHGQVPDRTRPLDRVGMFPPLHATSYIGQPSIDWGMREFSSVVSGVVRHDYQKSLEATA
jgi:hypothetical protein